MKSTLRKTFFLYPEFLGLFGVLSLVSAFINFLLVNFFKIEGLANIILYWLLYGASVAALTYTVRRIKGAWTWKDLGFRLYKGWRKDVWYGFVIASLIYVLTFPLEIVLLPKASELAMGSTDSLFQLSLIVLIPAAGIMSIIFGFITGAFHEEIWYRGYLQGLFSREVAPAAGFFFSLIVFSLGHYISHPEWSVLNVLNTVPHGIFFCLAYYATGSLLVCMVIHTLCNFFIPTIAVPLYAKGYHIESYITMTIFWFIFLLICITGRGKIKGLIQKTIELFKRSGLKASFFGVFLGALGLLFSWTRYILQEQMLKKNYLLILAVFSTLALGISFLCRNFNRKHFDGSF